MPEEPNAMNWFYIVVTLISVTGTAFAWLAKLKWSKEFADAKQETLKAKDAEITSLKTQLRLLEDLSSSKILDYHKRNVKELEAIIEKLENEKIQVEETIITISTQMRKNSETIGRIDEKADLLQELFDLNRNEFDTNNFNPRNEDPIDYLRKMVAEAKSSIHEEESTYLELKKEAERLDREAEDNIDGYET